MKTVRVLLLGTALMMVHLSLPLSAETEPSQGGIGVLVDLSTNGLLIRDVLPDTPAAKVGLAAGDLIAAIDDTSARGLTLEDGRQNLQGPVGTGVSLRIVRPGVATPMTVKLVRAIIQNPQKRETVKRYLTIPGDLSSAVTEDELRRLQGESETPATAGASQTTRVAVATHTFTPHDIDTLLKPLLASGQPISDDWIVKKLPAEVADAQLTYAGAFLVMKFQNFTKLGVFNLVRGDFDKFIAGMEDLGVMATGGKSVLLYRPSNDTIELWDLTTMTMRNATPVGLGQTVQYMGMGLLNDEIAVIRCSAGSRGFRQSQWGLVTLRDMTVHPLKATGATHEMDAPRIRLDTQCASLLAWRVGVRPAGFICADVSGDLIRLTYQHEDFGALNFANDQQYLLCGRGMILDRKGVALAQYENSMLLPVSGGDAFLQLTSGTNLFFRQLQSKDVIRYVTLPVAIEAKKKGEQLSDLAIDRRLIASAFVDRIVLIDNSTRSVYLRRLGCEQSPAAVQRGSEAPRPGTKWSRKLELTAVKAIQIVDAPKGVSLDERTMVLSWTIPENQESGVVEILLQVTFTDTKQDFHIERLRVLER